MKNLYSFSENPLNTEKFLYMAMKNTPKAKIEGPQRAKEGPKANEAVNKVAQTADKLNKMMTTLDKKISSLQEKVDKYKGLDKSKLGPKTASALAKSVNTLKYYKQLRVKLGQINKKFQNLDSIRNKEYSKTSIATLNSINREIDKHMVDFRKTIMRDMAQEIQKSFLNNRIGNVAMFKDFFTIMKNNETRSYSGFTISKQKDTLSMSYKGEKMSLQFKVDPKSFKWSVLKDGKQISESASKTDIPIEATASDTSQASGFPKSLLYSPGNTTKAWARFYKVKDVLKPKQTAKTAAKPKVAPKKAVAKLAKIEVRPTTALGKRVEGKIKVLQKWLKLKIGIAKTSHDEAMKEPGYKNAFNRIQTSIKRLNAAIREKNTTFKNQSLERIDNELNLVAKNTKAQFPPRLLPKKVVANKAEKWKDAVVETPETKKALKKWGNELGKRISSIADQLYGRITAAKQFLAASKQKNKMKHLTQYKNALAKVGKEVQTTTGTDIIREANKLTDAYRLIPSGLSKEWKDKFKVKITAPPSTKEKIALAPTLLNKKPQEIKKTPKKAVASKPQPAPKPKVVVSKAKLASVSPKLAKEFNINEKIKKPLIAALNEIEKGKQPSKQNIDKALGKTANLMLVSGAKKFNIVVKSTSGKYKMKIEADGATGKTKLTVIKNGVQYAALNNKGEMKIAKQTVKKAVASKPNLPSGRITQKPVRAPKVKKSNNLKRVVYNFKKGDTITPSVKKNKNKLKRVEYNFTEGATITPKGITIGFSPLDKRGLKNSVKELTNIYKKYNSINVNKFSNNHRSFFKENLQWISTMHKNKKLGARYSIAKNVTLIVNSKGEIKINKANEGTISYKPKNDKDKNV